jgi:adenosylcobinamide kinase/adenosylcobinamide-phosphate guanylyltransferase
MKKALILGGARSGKSTYAEKLAIATGQPKLYIATATRLDDEMDARINHHISRRDKSWHTIEETVNVASIITDKKWSDHVILVDCLTLWMSNLMFGEDEDVAKRRAELCDAVKNSNAKVILVTNEVGLGIVPMHPLSRRFRDEAGWLHQALAEVCDTVAFMAAGLPMMLKSAA